MRNFLLIPLLIMISSCLGTDSAPNEVASRLELIPEPDRKLRLEHERKSPFLAMATDSLWQYLVFEKGGCLTGGQYIAEGRRDERNCVMTAAKEWEIFFHRSQHELTDFLLSKLSDTTTTKIHTCPFFHASEGEVAVYALQQLHKTNWFDLDTFQPYRDSLGDGNLQSWLQTILQEETSRKDLHNYWAGLIKN